VSTPHSIIVMIFQPKLFVACIYFSLVATA
jgi:hypothetical protein